MTALLLAEFNDPARFAEAARRARAAHLRLVDAFSPFPVESVLELLDPHRSRIRVAMFIGGIAMAALAYGAEYFSAVLDYPYDSGGRPLNSWPAFMLVPFATGILVTAVCGFVAFLIETGLPRLHHPLFAVEGFEHASQDRFVLALERPTQQSERQRALDVMQAAGATWVREASS